MVKRSTVCRLPVQSCRVSDFMNSPHCEERNQAIQTMGQLCVFAIAVAMSRAWRAVSSAARYLRMWSPFQHYVDVRKPMPRQVLADEVP